MADTSLEDTAHLSTRSRVLVALPIGFAITVLSWFLALASVHVSSADWLTLVIFPAAVAGPLALPAHLAQSVGYAFLIVSACRMPARSRYLRLLFLLLTAHLALGLLWLALSRAA